MVDEYRAKPLTTPVRGVRVGPLPVRAVSQTAQFRAFAAVVSIADPSSINPLSVLWPDGDVLLWPDGEAVLWPA